MNRPDEPGEVEMSGVPGRPTTLRSEFATVRVWIDSTANGERLAIEVPRSGEVIYLDPLELLGLVQAGHDPYRKLLLGQMYRGADESVDDGGDGPS